MSTPMPGPCPAGAVPYTIKPGDSLYAIAQRLNVTVAAILSLNPGINPTMLQVGQSICVPGTLSVCPGGTVYRIQPGDTFYALAVRFGVSLSALLAANPGVDPSRLTVGQTICIPSSAPPTPTFISMPCCLLLQPVFSLLPPTADIPIGAVAARQVAMSTRSFTIVASALPTPGEFGNYDAYVAVLTLTSESFTPPPSIHVAHLISSSYGNQRTTWAGETGGVEIPAVGDTADIRPYNSSSGAQGPAFLRGSFGQCHIAAG